MAHTQGGNPVKGWPRIATMSTKITRGIVAGLLSAAAALGIAEGLAALMGGGSPVLVVGGTFVDATPRWLKEVAIETFGENDKTVLLLGIAVTIAVLAAVIGVIAQWRPRLGVAAVVILGLVPALSAVTRPTGEPIDAVPALVGAGVGGVFLWLFSRSPKSLENTSSENTSSEKPESRAAGSLSRRSFLMVAGAATVVAATAGVLGRGLANGRVDVEALRAALRLPRPSDAAPTLPASVDLKASGVSPYFTPNEDFYRVDTALSVPRIDSETWRLRIHGMVEQEVSYSFDDLLAMPLVERDITLTCVSNEVGGDLVGHARWLGVPVRLLLENARPTIDADQVVSRSVDGMTIGTPVAALMDGRDALLAVGMNGEPLPIEHGFPVRMVVPGLYGYVSACKWISEMEITTFGAYDAYWVNRGWDEEAPIKLASRIDTPRPLAEVSGVVQVGGVAWAQQHGIAGVEVRVDAGAWQDARLAGDGGIDSWRQWVWEWQSPSPGNHTLEVRATDQDGNVQVGERAEPFPSGSTGWHSVVVTVA